MLGNDNTGVARDELPSSLLVPNVVRYTVRLYEVLPCKQHLEYPPFLFPISMWFFMAITRTRILATHRRGFLEYEEQNELFKLPKILFYFVQSQDNSFRKARFTDFYNFVFIFTFKISSALQARVIKVYILKMLFAWQY